MCVQGLNPALVARLPEWQFDVQRLHVIPSNTMPDSDQPTALHNALIQLDTHLNTPTPMIMIDAPWQLTPELTQAVVAALPAQSALRLGLQLGDQVTDTELCQIRQMGPRVCGMLTPRTDAIDALWAWDRLWVWELGSTRLAELLHMPVPGGGGGRTIYLASLDIDSNLTQVRTACLPRSHGVTRFAAFEEGCFDAQAIYDSKHV